VVGRPGAGGRQPPAFHVELIVPVVALLKARSAP
jgi:hypothetical protein